MKNHMTETREGVDYSQKKRLSVGLTTIIIPALVVMVAIAGCGNRSTTASTGIALNDKGEIIALVPDSDGALLGEDAEDIGSALTMDDDNPQRKSSYFVQAKLDREQARTKQIEMLTEMINNTNIEKSQRAECANSLLEIQKRTEKESTAESMIEAKGFSEVYVRIDDTTVDVVVNKEALTYSEIAQIEDIVKRKTGMAADQIRISTIKKHLIMDEERSESSYFVQAKLDREQVRAKQKEMLTDMINNPNIEQSQRAECVASLLEIQKRIEKESAVEAILEAKGFSEVYVWIDDTTVDVVVNKEALTDSEIAQIEDIVKRKTGMAADQIRISTIKKQLAMDDDPSISIYGEEAQSTSATTEEVGLAATTDPGTVVFVNTRSESAYFVQAKLDREQVRSKQKEMLTDMINNPNVGQSQRAEYAGSLLEIQKRIGKESAAEAMIEAKGFSEVYVWIDDSTVDVVVNREALTDSEIVQIEDIIKRKTGMAADQIRISIIKKQ